MKWALTGAIALLAVMSSAQLKTKLAPNEAIRLRKGELVRYLKVRPNQIENGLPYQVLIVVRTDSFTVKTNKWEYTDNLNDKQKASLQEDMGYLDNEHLNMFKHEKGTAEEERDRLFFYLSARKGKQVITWNSKVYEPHGQVLLIETLEVYHYFGREAKEKAGE